MGAEDEAAAAAAQNGASNGDTAASSTQSASVEAGQPGARKRSRWAASNDEGGGEGGGDTKKRKSKWGMAAAPTAEEVASTLDPARVSKEAMAKAQRMAAIQAKIAAQMQSLGAVPGVPGVPGMVAVPGAINAFGGAAPKAPTFMPAPLILDDKGRHVDKEGKEVQLKPALVSTLRANQRDQRAIPLLEPPSMGKGDGEDGKPSIVDPRMKVGAAVRQKRATFTFVEDQRYIKRAERFRNKMAVAEFNEQLKRMKEDRGKEAEKETLQQVNLALLKTKLQSMPDTEWWDTRVLADGQTYTGADGAPALLEDKITIYVEHPVPIEPPSEAPAPPPLPMFLTKKERKKLRRRTRMERELQRQEMVARGFIPAPEPKVKISNMMRVLAADATADPTKIEQEVRKQMAVRLKNHEDRNQARKTTAEEKREKKLAKISRETEVETVVHLYKVGDLSSKHNLYKVSVNAQYHLLKGIGIVSDVCNMLVVEGGAKSLKKFQKLLLRRIKWGAEEEDDEAEDEMEEEEQVAGDKKNYCKLVWEGTVLKSNFPEFKFEAARTEGAAKELLRRRGVGHYWDLVRDFTVE